MTGTITIADRQDLRALLRRFLEQHSPESEVRRLMETAEGSDPAVWARFATELGVAGLNLPEDLGGAGLGWTELGIAVEEAGRTLLCAPLFSSVCLAGTALALCHELDVRSNSVPDLARGIVEGTRTATVALARASDTQGLLEPEFDVDRAGRISGRAMLVPDAGTANWIIVAAGAGESYGLYVVPTDNSDVSTKAMQSFDLTRKLYRIDLASAPSAPLVTGGPARRLTEALLDRATIALAAEQLGGMQYLLDLTVEYVSMREQFDRPVGSFQSVKHACADMLVDVEAARACVEAALAAIDHNADDVGIFASLAQVHCAEAYSRVASAAILLHGAIAYTWEHPAHLHLRRAKSSAQLLGPALWHRERLLAQVGI